MTGARLVARCARGLETVLAEEILRAGHGPVAGIGHREVHFDGVPGAAEPRTADDVFLLVARGPDVGPGRSGLAALARLAGAVDPARLAGTTPAETLAAGGRGDRSAHGPSSGGSFPAGSPAGGSPALPYGGSGVEVSASFLGRRNFNRYDAEDAVGEALARRLRLPYHSRRNGSAPPAGYGGWRLTLDGEHATLMLRLGDRPLHRRGYKTETVPGTLHPPVAAAMAILADIRPGQRVLDPCCGAATLLIEAHALQPQAMYQGVDAAPAALAAARANIARAGIGSAGIHVRRGDAAALPLGDATVDRVIANPPWGAQVTPLGRLAARPGAWWRELTRVLGSDGTATVIIPDPSVLATAIHHDLIPTQIRQIHVSGARPYLVRLTPSP
ncbi:methyltransferase domain-containing protein [Bailinhaonella thermotolerans]|uniref:Methyltransferase domain-containing protein n=1 Tax=Bailinhaonella thermotolerans TaxID=1070861 RepID=A0A3A4BCY6_9ACTN|nr:methyltransferase domain-containing protein [Bailinhaonella thermotolerans]RJL32068.1 methyltransferase domain-containing protein [Bailinhaonella thermotolerans]